ncbi:MAG: CCA tRNA nucleotidyltransferase [Candidatus Stahlbacteria bacterium]|nr:MAG: CCA tRNA nucleotidyltransferase [Candidatus Stahlbacteria bacterium]
MKTLEEFITGNQYIQAVKNLKGKKDLYLVGGTIRDILLGIQPKDYDFAVSGSGIKFATSFARKTKGAFVLLSKDDDEARVVEKDIIYDFIGFGKNGLLNDLKRRDFTINSMAINLDTLEFLDPFKGIKDLEKGLIRLTTDESLKTDPLRILRGFRFALELDFDLNKNFFKLAKGISLKKIAAERIGYEMLRIMAAQNSYKKILKMDELGLFKEIFPEAQKIIEDSYLWGHSLSTFYAIEELMKRSFFTKIEPEFSRYFSVPARIPLLKLAGLFHDVAKPDTFLLKEGDVHFYGHDIKGARIVQILGYKRLKFSRSEVAMLKKLVKEHMRLHLLATNKELTDRAIRRFFRDLDDDWFGAMMLAWADGYATAGWTKHLEHVFMRMIELKRADDAKPKVERLVNGYDLIALGLKPGPKFKIILQELLDMQLEAKIETKEQGLKIALEINKKI